MDSKTKQDRWVCISGNKDYQLKGCISVKIIVMLYFRKFVTDVACFLRSVTPRFMWRAMITGRRKDRFLPQAERFIKDITTSAKSIDLRLFFQFS
jgi:hypothetical protein